MRTVFLGVALGAAIFAFGATSVAFSTVDHNRVANLDSGAMDQLLGGSPTCLHTGSMFVDCVGTNCPAARECSAHPTSGCWKVVRTQYDICAETGSLTNYNCSADSTSENCGSQSYGPVDPMTKQCVPSGCTASTTPCGEPKIKTAVKVLGVTR